MSSCIMSTAFSSLKPKIAGRPSIAVAQSSVIDLLNIPISRILSSWCHRPNGILLCRTLMSTKPARWSMSGMSRLASTTQPNFSEKGPRNREYKTLRGCVSSTVPSSERASQMISWHSIHPPGLKFLVPRSACWGTVDILGWDGGRSTQMLFE